MILNLLNRYTEIKLGNLIVIKPRSKADAIWLCENNELLNADSIDMTEFKLGIMPLIRHI